MRRQCALAYAQKAAAILGVLESTNGGIVTDRQIKAIVWCDQAPPMDIGPYIGYIINQMGIAVRRCRKIGWQLVTAPAVGD